MTRERLSTPFVAAEIVCSIMHECRGGVTCRGHGDDQGKVAMTRVRRSLVCLAGVVALCVLAAPQVAQGRNPKPKGFISAKPSAVLVNETTTLEGSGFPADETIVLKECPKKAYGPEPKPAYKHPCDPTTMTVETDASGGFTATFEVRSPSGGTEADAPNQVLRR